MSCSFILLYDKKENRQYTLGYLFKIDFMICYIFSEISIFIKFYKPCSYKVSPKYI